MYRMYGMPWAHGCAGTANDRMYGMPWAHGCAGTANDRMYGMPWAHGCAGTANDRMYGQFSCFRHNPSTSIHLGSATKT